MRRLLTFTCEDAELGATLDPGAGETGLVLVTGGSQTRMARTACTSGLPTLWPNGG
jgi:hypothetical protein